MRWGETSEGAWTATWQGEFGANAGSALDVEFEVGDPVPWGSVTTTEDGVAGVSECGGVLTVTGRTTDLTADDVLALDVQPGIILVEMAGPRSAIHIEDFISFAPGEVSIYPTGIWSSNE